MTPTKSTDILLELGLHLGENNNRIHPFMFSHIIGYRYNMAIVNIYDTYQILRKAVSFVKYCGRYDNHFFFYNTLIYNYDVCWQLMFINFIYLKKTNISTSFSNWSFGTLTNFHIFFSSVLNQVIFQLKLRVSNFLKKLNSPKLEKHKKKYDGNKIIIKNYASMLWYFIKLLSFIQISDLHTRADVIVTKNSDININIEENISINYYNNGIDNYFTNIDADAIEIQKENTFEEIEMETYWKDIFLHYSKHWRFFSIYKFYSFINKLPDLAFVCTPDRNYSCFRECSLLNIPTIGIVDTDTRIFHITYPIYGNDNSLLIYYFLFCIFLKSYSIGKFSHD